MSDLPAEWLEKSAQAAREGVSRLQLSREAAKRVFEYRSASGTVSRLQGKPQCPRCWGYISEKQERQLNSARRALLIHFECEGCKHVFAHTPKRVRDGI